MMADPAIVTCSNCGKKNRVPAIAEGVPRCGNCHEPLPWIAEVDAGTFDAAVEADMPVMVDFWAPWCAPCRMVTPAVEALARNRAGSLKVVKLNIDTAPDLAARYDVQGIPLLLLMQEGREVNRLVGAAPEPQIREWLDRQLAAA
jgi:thioredoxin 2